MWMWILLFILFNGNILYFSINFKSISWGYEYKKAPITLKEKIASRIKVISRLDISEKRVPQDGRFKMKVTADRAIDFRVSSLPTILPTPFHMV